jgi:hypothetical protein
MQPTRSAFRMMVAAQRLHRAPPISGERRLEATANVRIARTAKVNEPDLAEKACRKTIRGLAGHQQHLAAPGRCHWKQEATAKAERIEKFEDLVLCPPCPFLDQDAFRL